MRSRRAIVFAHIGLLMLACACAGDDDDSAPDSADDVDDDSDLDDDADGDDDADDDAVDDDAEDDDGEDDDSDPPCHDPLTPPLGYQDYEALWLVARVLDPSSPVMAVYAFFWADWFAVDGCSWSAVEAVLFLRDDGSGETIAAGGKRPDWEFTQTPGTRYDTRAGDLIHARAMPGDSDAWRIDIASDGFDVAIDLDLRHVLVWSSRYLSWFDADAGVSGHVEGEEFESDAHATLERWWDMGSLNPMNGETDVIRGWWLYAPMHWRAADGTRASTLVWLWRGFAGDVEVTVRDDGAASIGDARIDIDTAEIDVDFPENDGVELNRYRLWGNLADGRAYEYEASVVRRYRDVYPDGWADFETPEYVETHDLVEGTLRVEGETYTGGGVQEWHVTRDNPLPPERTPLPPE
ncbi:MAG: hypothetical protein IT350_06205 [Deltaproteobacteria bacterium]|nr:hypothetical protein [Deltaproteobacteria bacterium]